MGGEGELGAGLMTARGPAFGPRVLVLALWTLLALAATMQRLVERVVLQGSNAVLPASQDLWLLALWALATPAIVWSVRRFPIRDVLARRHAVLHWVAATVFIVATNVVIRLPMLLPPWSRSATAGRSDLLLGLARFYPVALIVYGVIVALAAHAWAAAAKPASVEDRASPSVADTRVPPANQQQRSDRVVVREWNRVHLVRPDDIEWAAADDNYVVVHTGTRAYKGRGRIGDLESQLDPARFVRIHRSVIVHVAHIKEVQPLYKGDYAVILRDGKVLRVARRRRAALEAALGVTI
jgi:hypothetical protein